jgi:hypothetical protein
VQLSGTIFYDANANQTLDADEVAISNARVFIYGQTKDGRQYLHASVVVNSLGQWSEDVCASTYRVSLAAESLPTETVFTADTTNLITITADSHQNIGVTLAPAPISNWAIVPITTIITTPLVWSIWRFRLLSKLKIK